MTQTIKDPVEMTNSGKPVDSPRSNPVCLEVGVTIRSLPSEAAGMTKPIREEVRTVIVFDNGAVLRCSENLPIGHMFILSSPSGRDVVCRVVGGRNLPSVKGYVEVQFLESVSDFWDIHKSSDPAVAAAPASGLSALRETPVEMPAPAPLRAAVPLDAPPSKPASISLGSAPTFDDIGGLTSVSISPAAREPKPEPIRPGMEMAARGSSSYNQSGMGKPTSLANWDSPEAGLNPGKQTTPSMMDASSNSFSSSAPAPTREFMSKGLMAYDTGGSTSKESNARTPLIVGAVAALVLLGVGVGVVMMRRSTPPTSVAKIDPIVQPSPAERPAEKTGNESAQASQVAPSPPVMPAQASAQPVVVEQSEPAATVAPIPAVVTSPVTTDAKLDSRNSQRQAKNAATTKQADASLSRRPSITNLKMNSPSLPIQKLAELNGGSAPMAEIAATEPVAGSTPAGLLTSSGRTSNPPAPPPSVPAPVAAPKAMRDPKLISSSRVTYPASAKQSNVQGSVTISASIDAKGAVVDAKALSGPLLLRQAAVDSVKQWKYSPAQEDGKPVPAQVTVNVDFRLN